MPEPIRFREKTCARRESGLSLDDYIRNATMIAAGQRRARSFLFLVLASVLVLVLAFSPCPSPGPGPG